MSGSKNGFHHTLYFRVICGIVIGIIIGILFPQTAQALKPLGDAFILSSKSFRENDYEYVV